MIGVRMVSSAARPVYAHRGGPPPETIFRTFLASGFRTGGVPTLTIGPVVLGNTDTLLVGITYDNAGNVDDLHITTNGRQLQKSNDIDFQAFSRNVAAWSLPMAGTPNNATVIADFTTSAGQPLVAAMLAIAVSGLRQLLPEDVGQVGLGSGANQDSGLTPNTSIAHEFVWGLIGTNGGTGDAVGAWQAGMAAGATAGTVAAGVLIKEGWQVVNAIAQYRSQVIGATIRQWGALCETYRAA